MAEFFDIAMKLGMEGDHGVARLSAMSTRRARMCSWAAVESKTPVPRSFQARARGGARNWTFNHSSLFLDFLAGNQTYQCTPWSNPTYNVFGWQRPCYLMSDEGYAPSFRSLMEDTAWDKLWHGPQSALRQLHGSLRLRGHGGQRPAAPSAQGAARSAAWTAPHRSDGAGAAVSVRGAARRARCRSRAAQCGRREPRARAASAASIDKRRAGTASAWKRPAHPAVPARDAFAIS